MYVTELGMTRFPERLVQLLNAMSSISVTESPNTREVMPEHDANALLPIKVTVFGIVSVPVRLREFDISNQKRVS